VHGYGGTVVGFSGDAITCWFDGDSGTRAITAALAMQRWMGAHGASLGTSDQPLALRVGVATGDVWRFVAGDPSEQLVDAVAGPLLDSLAATGHAALVGEVVLDPSTVRSVREVVLRELRAAEGLAEPVAVVDALLEAAVPQPWPPGPALEETRLRPWLIPAVYERLRAGHSDLLAELRPAVALFLRFSGIDFEDDDAIARLDRFVRDVHRVLAEYEGALIQLTIGDKGRYLYAAFGAPVAHEDEAVRAVSAALELRELADDGIEEIAIGLAAGQMRVGAYGGAERMTYGVLGEATNLAARLMQVAGRGEVVGSTEIQRQTARRFEWKQLPELSLKGNAEPVVAFRLLAASADRPATSELPLLGRAAELVALEKQLGRALTGRGQVVSVTGPAGIGKTRLVQELIESARSQGVDVHSGECRPYGRGRSYLAWRPIWRSLLGDDPEAVSAALKAVDETLLPRLPLLGPVLDLDLPDNDLTRTFEPKLRKTSLESLLAECLRGLAKRGPLVIVIEDAHWIDPLAADLLDVLARAAADQRVLIALTRRHASADEPPLAVAGRRNFTDLALAELDEDAVGTLARLLVDGSTGDEVVARVVERAQGNPFYARQLLSYLEDDANAGADLPTSLQSLILSRIDRLAEAPRSTLKVASVVGRSFAAPMLPRVHHELGGRRAVARSLTTLESSDFVERQLRSVYLFTHILTQEVAYGAIPYAMRSALHERVANVIESDTGASELDLLAYHYGLSENEAKKRHYLLAAAHAAQRRYANAAAIAYFEQALPLLAGNERWDVLLKLGKTLELAGRWQEAEPRYAEVVAGGDPAHAARGEVARAELLRKQGRFDDALAANEHGRVGSLAVGDEAGVAQALNVAGTIAAQRGDYAASRAHYEASLEIRRRLGDRASEGSLLSNLGVVAEYEADYAAARSWNEQALALRTELGDSWAIAVSLNNLGNIALLQGAGEEARTLLERALALHREVGDPAMIANAGNNLANVLRTLAEHDAADRLYRESLALCRDLGDRWAIAYLLEDMAVLQAESEPGLALYLAGAASTLREAIAAPRPLASQQELEQELAPARSAPGAQEAWAQGAAAELDTVIEHALRET
jgi:predicted ATPase